MTRSRVFIVAFLSCASIFGGDARGQVLNLDAAPAGPTLSASNAASTLAQQLTLEAEQIEQALLQQSGHERVASEARACLRRSGAFLLGPTAARPWGESSAVVAGLRLARMRASIDALLAAFANERRVDDAATHASLSMEELSNADAMLREFSNEALDSVRRADPADTEAMSIALAQAMQPLADAVALLEGREIPNPWPGIARVAPVGDAFVMRDMTPHRSDANSLRAQLEKDQSLSTSLRAALIAALAPELPIPLQSRAERVEPLVRLALRARTAGLLTAEAIFSLDAEIQAACDAIRLGGPTPSGDPEHPQASDAVSPAPLSSVEQCAPEMSALLTMIDGRIKLDRQPEKLHETLRAIANAFAVSQFGGGATAGADRRSAMERCGEVMVFLATIRLQQVDDLSPELNLIARQLVRDGRAAELSALRSLEQVAAGGTSFADPEVISAIERIRTLTVDCRELNQLSMTVDRITALKPSLAPAMDRRARLIAKLLTDKLKRPDAIRALQTLQAQTARYAPFPLEERLKRDDAALTELCGSSCAAIAQLGAARRLAWAESWARGDTDSPEFAKMDRFTRLARAIEVLAGREDSAISRRVTDSISLWGNWCVSRASFVPATMDSAALLRLACASLRAGEEERFDADLMRLEATIPIAALVELLRKELGSGFTNRPITAAAEIAPVAIKPPPHAWMAHQRAQFAVFCRTMLELEGARSRGDTTLENSLRDFASSTAHDLNEIMEPTPRATGQIPSIDAAIEVPPPRTSNRRATTTQPAASAPGTAAPTAPRTSPNPPTPAQPAAPTKPSDGAKSPTGEDATPTGGRVPRVDSKDRAPRLPRQGTPTTEPTAEPKKDNK